MSEPVDSVVEELPYKRIKLEDIRAPAEKTEEPETTQQDVASTTKSDSTIAEQAPAEPMLFRLRLGNMPKFFDPKSVTKVLKQYGVVDGKVKKAPQWDFANVTFQDEAAMEAAREKLNGITIKKNVITAEVDTVRAEAHRQRFDDKHKVPKETKEDSRTPAEKLADQVTPLWKMTYEDQLIHKSRKMRSVLQKNFIKEMKNLPQMSAEQHQARKWAMDKLPGTSLPFPVSDILPSPVTTGYRTKCEFTIGQDLQGDNAVGFLLGLYKEGITAVLDPSETLIVTPLGKRIANAMKRYVDQSGLSVYDKRTKEGHWRQLQVRTQSTNESMVIVQMHPQNLTPEELTKQKEGLKRFFETLQDDEGTLNITTLLFQSWDGASNGIKEEEPMEVLVGPGYIHETILGCTFRISPTAFFQVNTPATEVLYSKCAEWANVNAEKPTTLLDLCCGTGTIGITMAKSVKKVIGIEMVAQAIEDAKENAKRNNVDNADYWCAKVEDALHVINRLPADEEVVAIMDPPRSGLHQDVIKAVRKCNTLKRIIYVACAAEQASKNFVNLCRPSSKAWEGTPFKPTRAIPVDLFPHTEHCELIITHSALTSYVVYSRVRYEQADTDHWSICVYAKSDCFEFELVRSEASDHLLTSSESKSWSDLASRFETAFKNGEIHVTESATHTSCTLTVDNTSNYPIVFDLHRLSVNSKNEVIKTLMDEIAADVIKRGCKIGGGNEAPVREIQRLEAEVLKYRNEAEKARKTVTDLTQSMVSARREGEHGAGLQKAIASPKPASSKMNMIRKRKGQSLINPRVRMTKPQEVEFDDDATDEDA